MGTIDRWCCLRTAIAGGILASVGCNRQAFLTGRRLCKRLGLFVYFVALGPAPLGFIAKLATLVPSPRANLTGFHGEANSSYFVGHAGRADTLILVR